MKISLAIIIIICALSIGWWRTHPVTVPSATNESTQPITSENIFESSPNAEIVPVIRHWAEPLSHASARVTKKPFGRYIDPITSPVQPERFRGYHAGTDFEIVSGEENSSVMVAAVCTGELVEKRWVSGYGGLVVTRCRLDEKSLYVNYGHLALSTVKANIGDTVEVGTALGELGAGGSRDTDGERKHLHLGFFLGKTMNIRGYVTTKGELDSWLDPCQFVCTDEDQ